MGQSLTLNKKSKIEKQNLIISRFKSSLNENKNDSEYNIKDY